MPLPKQGIITIEEHVEMGGLAGAVTETCARAGVNWFLDQ